MLDNLGTFTNEHTVQIERLMPGPIELVWDYLTKADKLKTWLAIGEIEERVGATVALSQDSDEVPFRADHVFRGEVTQCDPPHLLAWTWDEDPPSEVSFRLESVGDRVKLTLTHERLLPEYLATVAAGWHGLLDFMVAHIEGATPDPFMTKFEDLESAYQDRLPAS